MMRKRECVAAEYAVSSSIEDTAMEDFMRTPLVDSAITGYPNSVPQTVQVQLYPVFFPLSADQLNCRIACLVRGGYACPLQ